MVSLIQSNYSLFGSGIVAPGTGFVLHNRGALFTLDAASPNALAGRKRPRHTIIPAFAQKGRVHGCVWHHGWLEQVAGPRAVHCQSGGLQDEHSGSARGGAIHKADIDGCDVQMEDRFSQKVRDDLTAKGHKIKVMGPFPRRWAGGQAVLRDFAKGVNYGASDPRKDGAGDSGITFRHN